MGEGNITITSGNGANTYAFIKDSFGGSETITNFNADSGVVLIGYGQNEVTNALAPRPQPLRTTQYRADLSRCANAEYNQRADF